MRRILNLTPHKINIYRGWQDVLYVLPSDGNVRLREVTEPAAPMVLWEPAVPEWDDFCERVPVVRKTYGNPEFSGTLPDSGDVVIVSGLAGPVVRRALGGDTRVLSPDTGPDSVVRDSEGKILGVRRFIEW